MKLLFIYLVAFLMTPLITVGQNGFEFKNLSSNSTRIIDVLEDEDNTFLLVGEYKDFSEIILIKLDNLGQELDRNYFSIDSTNLEPVSLIKYGDRFMISGSSKKFNSTLVQNQLFTLEIDNSLEKVNEYFFNTEDTQNIFLINFKSVGNTLKFAGFTNLYKLLVGEINLTDSTYVYKRYNDQISVFNSFDFDSNGVMHVFGDEALYVIDGNYEVDEVIDFEVDDFHLTQQGQLFYLNSNEMLITNIHKKYFSDYNSIFIGKYTEDLEIIEYDTLVSYNIDSTIYTNIPAPFNSIALSESQDKCYIGGILEFNYINYPYAGNENYFLLSKYAVSPLEKQWEKTYGGDGYYIMHGLKWISDGGCLMYGFRYKSENDVLEAYALKVDENGIITGETAIPMPSIEVKIYPNPFVKDFTLEVEDFEGLNLVVYDAQGRLVHQTKLMNTQTNIYLGNVASGSYTYLLSRGHTPVKSGQLIKQ